MRREAAHRLGTSKSNLRWSEHDDGQYVRADQPTPDSVKALEPSGSEGSEGSESPCSPQAGDKKRAASESPAG